MIGDAPRAPAPDSRLAAPVRSPRADAAAFLHAIREVPGLRNGRSGEENAYRLACAQAMERLEFVHGATGMYTVGKRFYEECHNIDRVRLRVCSEDPAHDLTFTMCECGNPFCEENARQRQLDLAAHLRQAFHDVEMRGARDFGLKHITITTSLSPYNEDGSLKHHDRVKQDKLLVRRAASELLPRYLDVWSQLARWWKSGRPLNRYGEPYRLQKNARILHAWFMRQQSNPSDHWKTRWFFRNLDRLADGVPFSKWTFGAAPPSPRGYEDVLGAYGGVEWGEKGYKLHAHIVAFTPYLCVDLLKALWRDQTGNEVLKVKGVDDPGKAALEVAKYATKLVKDGVRLDPELVAVLCYALRGSRRMFGRGVFFRLESDDEDESAHGCRECGAPMEHINHEDVPGLMATTPRFAELARRVLPGELLNLIVSNNSALESQSDNDSVPRAPPDPPPERPRQFILEGFSPKTANREFYP